MFVRTEDGGTLCNLDRATMVQVVKVPAVGPAHDEANGVPVGRHEEGYMVRALFEGRHMDLTGVKATEEEATAILDRIASREHELLDLAHLR